jgi:hypothetical protein
MFADIFNINADRRNNNEYSHDLYFKFYEKKNAIDKIDTAYTFVFVCENSPYASLGNPACHMRI